MIPWGSWMFDGGVCPLDLGGWFAWMLQQLLDKHHLCASITSSQWTGAMQHRYHPGELLAVSISIEFYTRSTQCLLSNVSEV